MNESEQLFRQRKYTPEVHPLLLVGVCESFGHYERLEIAEQPAKIPEIGDKQAVVPRCD
jgi:hypothetical protein